MPQPNTASAWRWALAGCTVLLLACLQPASAADQAYVTLLYGDFLLGVRVLGQSLRESKTDR